MPSAMPAQTDAQRHVPASRQMIPEAYCHARLPNAGLGNKLFVWARAHMFASLNDLPLRVTGWVQFQMAPLLKGGDLRLYWNYFRPVEQIGRQARQIAERDYRIVQEPPVERVEKARGVIYEY